jgi:hypothetical protein
MLLQAPGATDLLRRGWQGARRHTFNVALHYQRSEQIAQLIRVGMLRLSLVAAPSNMFPHCLRKLVPPATRRSDFACEQRRVIALQARMSCSCYKDHLSRPCSMRLNTIQAASLPCSSNMCVRKRGTLPQDADSKVELQQQAWGEGMCTGGTSSCMPQSCSPEDLQDVG